MALLATATASFTLVPENTYQGVCVDIMDLGYNTYQFKDPQTGVEKPSTIHEISVVFQLNQINPESGKRFEISRKFNLSLNEKASLRGFLKSWRGRDMAENEMNAPGFDVESMIGQQGMVQVIHNKKGDKTYSNIGTIMPLFQGIPPMAALDYVRKDLPPKAAANNYQQPPVQTDAVTPNGVEIPF